MLRRLPIVNWLAMIVLLFFISIAIGAQYLVAFIVNDGTQITTNASCTSKQLERPWYDRLHLTMDCNGSEYYVNDEPTIIAIVNAGESSTCTLYKTGRAECKTPAS